MPTRPAYTFWFLLAASTAMTACAGSDVGESDSAELAPGWEVDFFDDFETFDAANWQDQQIWVNDEDQCYVPGACTGPAK